jgi:hypothetical protein
VIYLVRVSNVTHVQSTARYGRVAGKVPSPVLFFTAHFWRRLLRPQRVCRSVWWLEYFVWC